MTKQGVDEFLSLLIGVLLDILAGRRSTSETNIQLAGAIENAVIISTRKWMPEKWIITTDHAIPTREIDLVDIAVRQVP